MNSEETSEDDGGRVEMPEGISGRGAGRGRGRGRGRGCGRQEEAVESDLAAGEVIMSDFDISEDEEADVGGDDDSDGKFILAKDGTVFVSCE